MEYLVIFLNYNGAELYRTVVHEGETAVYEGEKPLKPNEEFIGWNKTLTNIRDNLIVTAMFEKPRTGRLKLGAISFIENDKDIKVIDNAVISNEDLYISKETDIER